MAAKAVKSIGEQVQEARVAAGLTQQELADKIGISRVFIAKIETSAETATNPTFDLMLALEAVLELEWFGAPLSHYVAAKRTELGVFKRRRRQ